MGAFTKMALTGFLFGGETGETPESLARKREIQDQLAAHLMGQQPTTALGGIGAILGDLGLAYARYRDNKAETAGRKSFDDEFSSHVLGNPLSSATPIIPNTTSVPNVPGTMENARNADRSSTPGYAPSPSMANLNGNDIYNGFMNTVQGNVKNPYALAAIAATAQHESAFSPTNANRSWNDGKNMAGGIMSWNGPRLNNLYAYAASKGERPGNISPQTQAEFFLQENPQLTGALQNAKSVEEAQQLMNNAWAFKGYNQPGNAEATGRLRSAQNFLPRFQSPDASTTGAITPTQASTDTTAQPVQVADNSNALPASTSTQTTQQSNNPLAGVDPYWIKVYSSPWSKPEQKAIAQQMIQNQMQANDPMHQMELKKGQLELNALEHPKTARMLTADEKSAAGLPSDGVYQQETDGSIKTVREPNKPMSAWTKMDDGRVLNSVTGEIKDLPPEANPQVPDAIKVLNARADAAGLKQGSPERAQFMLDNGVPQKPSSDWTKLNDGRLYNQKTGEIKDLPVNPNEPMPDAVRALDARAKAAGYRPGTPQYEAFMANAGNPDSQIVTPKDGSIFLVNKQTGEKKTVYGAQDQTPNAFKVLDARAKAAGYQPGTPEYQQFMATGGAPSRIPPDIQGYNLYTQQEKAAGRTPLDYTPWLQQMKKAGANTNNLTVDQKAESAFDKKVAEKQADVFSTMSTEGLNSRSDLAVIDRLNSLMSGQGGMLTGLSSKLASWGIPVEGADDLQAAQALINKLTPSQRAPGTGTLSDRDIEMFRASLPSLWNQPGGNEKIISVMRGLADYKQKQGEIADMVLEGEMTRQEGRRALRALPNPLADFNKDASKQAPDDTNGQQPVLTQPALTQPGQTSVQPVIPNNATQTQTQPSIDDLLKKYGGQ